MSDFPSQLRAAREERGVTLRQIATGTKISMRVLEALERGEYSRLPGGIFSRAFVRAYAIEVGLDPEAAVRDFLVEFEQAHRDAKISEPPEVTEDDRLFLERQRRASIALRSAVIVIGLLIVAAAVYFGFLRNRS